jgi:hypothetical protein
MVDSGAIYKLTSKSDTNTRAPHSWWVDVQARLGLAGILLALLLCLNVARRVRVVVGPAGKDHGLLTIASLVVLSLIPPLSFGVIMESPFGALPFYWCSGVILGYAALHRERWGADATESNGADANGRRVLRERSTWAGLNVSSRGLVPCPKSPGSDASDA